MLINNAGILRDKMSFNMTEEEWDAVINVHLKGHFVTSRFAAAYWRQQSKDTGGPVDAAIVNTVVRVGALRQRGPGELRGGQGRHRVDDDRHGARARAYRRARERDRAGRAHPAHRERSRGDFMNAKERRVRPLRPGEPGGDRGAGSPRPLATGISGQVVKVQGGQTQLLRGWRPVTEVTLGRGLDARLDRRRAATRCSATADTGVPPFMPAVES